MYTSIQDFVPQPQPLPEPRGQAQAVGQIGEFLSSPWVVLALVGGAIWYMSREEKKKAAKKRRRRKIKQPGDSAPGWYAVGYNYPVGHKDRRVKLVKGPYKTKEQAQREKAKEDPPWYVDVRYRKTMP